MTIIVYLAWRCATKTLLMSIVIVITMANNIKRQIYKGFWRSGTSAGEKEPTPAKKIMENKTDVRLPSVKLVFTMRLVFWSAFARYLTKPNSNPSVDKSPNKAAIEFVADANPTSLVA